MSFVYIGFDLVPKLSNSESSANKWSMFIADVSEKYQKDVNVFSQEAMFIKFTLGDNNEPKLPLQGHKFQRFCIGYMNKNKVFKKSLSYVKGVFQIAKKHFGDHAKFFDEGQGELGHYRWQDVEQMQATYGDFSLLDKRSGGGGDNNAAVRDGGEGGPGYEPGETIQKWVHPFVKILVGPSRLSRCSHCWKESDELFACNKCKFNYYCSTTCLTLDLKKGHMYECRSLSYRNMADLQGPGELDMSLKLLRLLSYLKQCPEKAFETVTIYTGSSKSFNNLSERISMKEIETNLGFNAYSMLLRLELEASPVFTKEDVQHEKLLRYLTLWQKFHMKIPDYTGRVIGSAIYIHTAFFNRAQSPNAECIPLATEPYVIQTQALIPIPPGVTPTIASFELGGQ